MVTTLEQKQRIDFAAGSGLIHPAIINIMRAVDPIAKSRENKAQGYNYRGIDQIYNAVHPHFAEQGVYSTSEIVEAKHLDGKNDKGKTYVHAILKMRFTFWASDGSNVATEVIGEGIDYGGDKASNKAMSVADKYAILQLLKIPTAMVDSDAPSPEEVKAAALPAAPKKSAMELMKEAAAAEAAGENGHANGDGQPAAAATTTEPAATVADAGAFATHPQVKRLAELAVKLQCGDKIEAACKKRGCNSIRSLKQADAQTIIDKLEAELAKVEAAAAEQADAMSGQSQVPPAAKEYSASGPATQDQIDACNAELKKLAQILPAKYDAMREEIKQKLAASGKARLRDLTANDAARLYQAIRNGSLAAFIQLSLESYEPKEPAKN